MLLLTLVVMALRLPLRALITMLPGGDDPAIYYAGLILQEAILWGLPALLMRPWRSDALPQHERCLGGCVAALLLGAVAQCALIPVTRWWSQVIGAELTGMTLPENSVQWLLASLALCLTPALCEEAFFRGSVLTGFTLSAQKWAAMLLTTLMFALMHGNLTGLPAHLTVSLLATLMMLRYGKLRVPVLFHLGYNMASLGTAYLPLDLRTSAPLGLLLLASALWIAGGVRWHSRKRMTWQDRLLCLLTLLGIGAAYLPELLKL